ncbi:MAG: sigma-54-dependent Fis family transcriptional regulator [Calditrichaceae bacterium]|nr:sigma-54-dependent Fis family transcriptional regulator [Calditrichaceae bacterium]RQV95843.1 MAG: sigma-54-dependent Fis family transcriptional regulator [Calditrichota bacterium]
MYRLLIADDEAAMLKGIELNLQENKNFEILTASNKKEAFEILANNEIDLVVSDLMMPDIQDGLDVMKTAKEQWYKPSVIAMTAFETVKNAVMAMQAGADDFLSKGFGIDELSFRIKHLLKKKSELEQLAIENSLLKETIQEQFNDYKIIGNSPGMMKLMQRIEKIAIDAQASCLIYGESGVGKDLVARIIHATGRRKDGPFVPVNCAAIPDTLIESELFGHEKGAFTGAISTKPGRFEQARSGIIFLDEIGELPLSLQVRLLRVLEDKSFYRLGGKRSIEVDVMVISATNKDLQKMVDEKKFREDLFFRLNVVNLYIPPLRERRDDILPLADFFVKRFNQQRKRQLKLSPKALQLLEKYDFPGNVRELRNIIEDAYVFCEGSTILPENLSLQKLKSYTTSHNDESVLNDKDDIEPYVNLPLNEALNKFEYDYFLNLLESNYWNHSLAAQKAGISREWLHKKIRKLDLLKSVND